MQLRTQASAVDLAHFLMSSTVQFSCVLVVMGLDLAGVHSVGSVEQREAALSQLIFVCLALLMFFSSKSQVVLCTWYLQYFTLLRIQINTEEISNQNENQIQ